MTKRGIVIITMFLFTAFMVFGKDLTIGVVDSNKVLRKYLEVEGSQKFLEKKRSDLNNILSEEGKKLSEEEKKIKGKKKELSKADQEKIRKMQEEFMTKKSMLQKQLDQTQYTVMQKVTTDIQMAVKEVAKSKKFSYIFERAAVPFGGQDVTNDVIKFLSSAKKINLD